MMQHAVSRSDRVRRGFHTFALTLVGMLFALINVWLLLLSGFSTSYISSGNSEKTFFVRDHILLNVLAAGILLLVLFVLRRKESAVRKQLSRFSFFRSLTFVKAKRILLAVTFLFGMFWVLSTQIVPGADQAAVLNAAAGLHTKSYALFAPGEYISRFPHQIGMVTVLYALGFLFGDSNYLAFQVLNVCGIVLIYKALSELAGLFGLSRRGQLMVLVTCLFFFPLTLYASFLYGTVLGLVCSLLAIQQELMYFRDFRRRRILAESVGIALAIFFKSNYLIFFIGMLLLALLECIRQKKGRILVLVLMMAVCYVGQSVVPRTLIQLKTGYDMGNGMSSLAYIAMGLQENNQRASGWYNKYNDNSFNSAGFDPDKQAAVCMDDIIQSLRNFANGKRDAVRFFSEKTASQWNNPTFQCLWISQVRPSAISRSAWLRCVLSAPGSTAAAGYLNLLQFIILFGSLLSLFLSSPAWRRESFILKVIVVGGFVFHLFWEAKAQYTLPYFVLLIPLAVGGYSGLLDRICSPSADSHGVSSGLSARKTTVCIAGILAAALLSFVVPPLRTMLQPTGDTEAFQQYVQMHTADTSIPDGEYVIQPYEDSDTCLSDILSGRESNDITLSADQKPVLLSSYMNVYRIRFSQSQRFLEFPILYNGAKSGAVQSRERDNTDIQEWRLLSAGEENCAFLMIGENCALTYDTASRTVQITQFTGADNQKWRFTIP